MLSLESIHRYTAHIAERFQSQRIRGIGLMPLAPTNAISPYAIGSTAIGPCDQNIFCRG